MKFELSDKERSIQRSAASVATLLNAHQRTRSDKKYQKADHLVFAEYGLTGAMIPNFHGGPGMNALETALSLEGFAAANGDPSFIFSLGAHLLACVQPLVQHASLDLQQRLFPGIVSGELLLANAMTEHRSGSDAFNMTTIAKKTEHGYRLNGAKYFISSATIADGYIVYALTDETKGFFGGISCFFVPSNAHGLRTEDAAMSGAYTNMHMGTVYLSDVSVPQENLIGKEGAGAMIFHQSMNWERACMSLMHCGTMQLLCEHAVANAKTKETKNGKLADLQAVQFHIAEMHLQLETSRLLATKALNEIDGGKDATIAAARAKIFASEGMDLVARTALKLDGAAGFHSSNENIHRAITNAQAAMIYSGPNDLLRELIAGRM